MSVQAITLALAIRGVSSSEKLVLLALANYADESMRCYPSQKRLADDTCLTDRTMRTVIASLIEQGLLSKVERRRPDGTRASDLFTLDLGGQGQPETISASEQAENASAGHAEIHVPDMRKSTADHAERISGPTTFEPSLTRQIEEPIIDWSARLAEAQAVAKGAYDPTATAMMHARDLRSLVEPACGDGCEWGEVLDAVRMCAARAKSRGKPLRSWAWVKDDAIALRDKRLNSTLPPVSHERPRQQTRKRDDYLERLADIDAAMGAAVQQSTG